VASARRDHPRRRPDLDERGKRTRIDLADDEQGRQTTVRVQRLEPAQSLVVGAVEDREHDRCGYARVGDHHLRLVPELRENTDLRDRIQRPGPELGWVLPSSFSHPCMPAFLNRAARWKASQPPPGSLPGTGGAHAGQPSWLAARPADRLPRHKWLSSRRKRRFPVLSGHYKRH